jgi:hypothetical protein
VHLGNEGRGGWTRAPRQRRSNDSAPIGLLGRSQDTQEFRIALRLEEGLAGFRWATGLAPRARLEWQVAPLGAPFSATDFESGPDQPISALPLAFNELAQFVADAPHALPNGTAHHQASNVHCWRARVRTNNPVFPVTPWVSFAGSNTTETKLRTGNNAPGHGSAK